MKLRDIAHVMKEDKGFLVKCFAIIAFASVCVLAIFNFSAIWSAVGSIYVIVSPLLYGIVVAYVLNVLVRFFEKIVFYPLNRVLKGKWIKIRRPLSIVLAYVMVICTILMVFLFIIPGVIESTSDVVALASERLPVYLQQARDWALEFASKNDLSMVSDYIKGLNWNEIIPNITNATTQVLGYVMNATVNVANGVVTAFLAIIFSAYMLFGKTRLLKSVKAAVFAFCSRKRAKKIYRIAHITDNVFFSFIKGQLVECVILGLLCYVGMNILGFAIGPTCRLDDYALLISAIVTLSALIPIFGAFIGAIIGSLILLLIHPIDALWFLIFLLILQQVEGNLIYPKVVGDSIGLPPVWTMFAVMFWSGILNIAGILVGVPITAVIYQLLRGSVNRRLSAKGIDRNVSDVILEEETEDAEATAHAGALKSEKNKADAPSSDEG